MLKYIGRRILMMIPILLAVTFVVFTLLYITPGNPAELMLGQNATPEAVAELEEELGLNRPFLVRYAAPNVSMRFMSGFPFFAQNTRARISSHRLPLTRTMAMPPSPAAVACAAMVSR